MITRLNDPLMAYPVGSIYMSVSSTDPGTLFGGTWERITGKFLLAATDNGAAGGNSNASIAAGGTGGEAAHTLSSAESGVPAHAHSVNAVSITSSGAHTHKGKYDKDQLAKGTAYNRFNTSGSTMTVDSNFIPSSGAHTHTVPAHNTNNNTAANAANAHNNMPPYLAVYVWKRTA